MVNSTCCQGWLQLRRFTHSGACTSTRSTPIARHAPEAGVHLARLLQCNHLLQLLLECLWVIPAATHGRKAQASGATLCLPRPRV